MSALDDLDWREVRIHYDEREEIHRQLLKLHRNNNLSEFVRLLLGVSNRAGNYSADDHKLGPQILKENRNAERQVGDLAVKFMALDTARAVPELIKKAGIHYLKIGVGSEASCMVNPRVCWVANTRTIWTHLVIKHADNSAKADEELKLYRTQDGTSEMAYQIWAAIHRELATSMTRIAEEGNKLARKASVMPGSIQYIWADAIANALYASYYE
jgi:hypothetical protein